MRACYPSDRPQPQGVTRFVTGWWTNAYGIRVRRAGACPRRPREFTAPPTKFPRTKAFPLGGRWPGKAGSDEGRQRKSNHQRQKSNVSTPHQSKIKDFCQLLPREKPNPLRHGWRRATSPIGRGKCGVLPVRYGSAVIGKFCTIFCFLRCAYHRNVTCSVDCQRPLLYSIRTAIPFLIRR